MVFYITSLLFSFNEMPLLSAIEITPTPTTTTSWRAGLNIFTSFTMEKNREDRQMSVGEMKNAKTLNCRVWKL